MIRRVYINTRYLTIFGDGQQTRTLVYVHDLVDGLLCLADVSTTMTQDPESTTSYSTTKREDPESITSYPVVNLGGQVELTVYQIAQLTIQFFDTFFASSSYNSSSTCSSSSSNSSLIRFKEKRADDPMKRKPCLKKANEWLRWQPKVSLLTGLYEMMESYRILLLE